MSMEWLASTGDAKETCAELHTLFSAYSEWPQQLRREADDLEPRLRDLSAVQIGAVEERVARLNYGIDLLASDPKAFLAFRFANEVMARVQFRTAPDTRKTYKIGEPMDDAARAGTWYPFQLAFLLSVLPDFVFPVGSERSVVDVYSFPRAAERPRHT